MIATVYLLLAALTLGARSGAGSDPVPPLIPHKHTLYPSEATPQLGFATVELDVRSMTIRFYDGDGNAISKPFVFRR